MGLSRIEGPQATTAPNTSKVEPNVTVNGNSYNAAIKDGAPMIGGPRLEMDLVTPNGVKHYGFRNDGTPLGAKDGYDTPSNPDALKKDARAILGDNKWITGQHATKDFADGLKGRISQPVVNSLTP